MSTSKAKSKSSFLFILGITISTTAITALYLHHRRSRRRHVKNKTNKSNHINNNPIQHDLQIKFEKAISIYTNHKSNLHQYIPNTNDQLMIYGLYKQAQFGDSNTSSTNLYGPTKLLSCIIWSDTGV